MLKLSWIGIGVAQAIEPKSTLQLKDREVSFLISFEDNSYIGQAMYSLSWLVAVVFVLMHASMLNYQ